MADENTATTKVRRSRHQKAQDDKERLSKKRDALKAKLEKLDQEEKRLDDIIENFTKESRAERTHRLIKFAGDVEVIFGKDTANDLLLEAIKANATSIRKSFNMSKSGEAEKAKQDIIKHQKELLEKNAELQIKIAAMQKPNADVGALANAVRRLNFEICELNRKIEEAKEKATFIADDSNDNNVEPSCAPIFNFEKDASHLN